MTCSLYHDNLWSQSTVYPPPTEPTPSPTLRLTRSTQLGEPPRSFAQIFLSSLPSSVQIHVFTSSQKPFPQMSSLIFPRCTLSPSSLPLGVCSGRGYSCSVRPKWKLFRVGHSHKCQRDVYMCWGVESGQADTLQSQWNEVRRREKFSVTVRGQR